MSKSIEKVMKDFLQEIESENEIKWVKKIGNAFKYSEKNFESIDKGFIHVQTMFRFAGEEILGLRKQIESLSDRLSSLENKKETPKKWH